MRLWLIIAIVCTQTLLAQKQVHREIDARGVDLISINTDRIFNVTLTSSDSSFIVIETSSEGEYFQDIVITTKRSENSLSIGNEFQPAFKNANDKLSAHKVIAIDMTIKIPKNKKVQLTSDITNLIASGDHVSLRAVLHSGNCILKSFFGGANIQTYSGNITLKETSGDISAFSKNGKVTVGTQNNSSPKISLKSIHGDITVIKTE